MKNSEKLSLFRKGNNTSYGITDVVCQKEISLNVVAIANLNYSSRIDNFGNGKAPECTHRNTCRHTPNFANCLIPNNGGDPVPVPVLPLSKQVSVCFVNC
jgi:hypothetical protein